jgi:anti-sigma B factor antagonist
MLGTEPGEINFSVSHEAESDWHVLTVSGELDVFAAPDLADELEKAMRAPRIIVDLSQCRYIDSTGIAALFRAHKRSGERIRLVVGDQQTIRRILRVTRVETLMPVFENLEDAKKP